MKIDHLLYELLYTYFSYTRYEVLKKELGLNESYADIGGQKVCYFESPNEGISMI